MEKKILLVVDYHPYMEETADILRKAGYNRIVGDENGRKAIQAFKTDRPDLVVLDLDLTSMNGLRVLKELKTIDPNVPVICSNPYAKKIEDEAHKAGADDFVFKAGKHWNERSLILAVRTALGDRSRPIHLDTIKLLGDAQIKGVPGKNIFAVGHSIGMQNLIRSAMDAAGYNVIATASDGSDAVELFKLIGPEINLIIMDAVLSDMSGADALRAIHGLSSTVPMIICASQCTESTVRDSIEAGAKDFILLTPTKGLDRLVLSANAILG